MGKNKIKKFEKMEEIPFVFQYPWGRLQKEDFPLRGCWKKEFFKNNKDIVLELGCGKGEYTVGLAERDPSKNYIGVDIKGARMYTGATMAEEKKMSNVAFIRTSIELIEKFFTPGEVSQIWITFPDPQMKKTTKRLTSTRFLNLYRKILSPGGVIHLKTDSKFLYTYTTLLARDNESAIKVMFNTSDLYSETNTRGLNLDIRTHYEQQWLDRGLTIKYIAMTIDSDTPLVEVTEDIPEDTYRSYSRGYIQMPQLMSEENIK